MRRVIFQTLYSNHVWIVCKEKKIVFLGKDQRIGSSSQTHVWTIGSIKFHAKLNDVWTNMNLTTKKKDFCQRIFTVIENSDATC